MYALEKKRSDPQMPDMLVKNELKVLRTVFDKIKLDRIRNQQTENPVISNQLMNGWKTKEWNE